MAILFWIQSSPFIFYKPLKNEAAELLKVSQVNSFDFVRLSSYNAYLDIAAFCLFDLSLPAFLDI